jgi:hypothetical protein
MARTVGRTVGTLPAARSRRAQSLSISLAPPPARPPPSPLSLPFSLCEQVGTLVPVLDMLNHSPDSTLAAHCALAEATEPSERAYLVKALRDYAAGDQICIQYGPWGNAGLFFFLGHCGFAVAKNALVD